MKVATKTWQIVKNNIILIILLAAALFLAGVRMYYINTSTTLVFGSMGIYFLLSLAILFPREKYHQVFKALVTVSTPLAVAIVALRHHVDPHAADIFSYEDGPLETLSMLVLFIASAIWVVYAFSQVWKRRWLVSLIAAGIGVVFFVIGMEEISWGQRILDIESSEFFLENNIQAETNLHNLNTGMSETIYYAGGILALIVIPFYQKPLKVILEKYRRTKGLSTFVPSYWILVPFTAILGFFGRGNVALRPLLLMLFMFGFAVLIYRLINYFHLKFKLEFIGNLAIAVIVMVSAYTFFTFNADTLVVRSWYYSEYLEFFIALGLLVYTIDYMFRNVELLSGAVNNKNE